MEEWTEERKKETANAISRLAADVYMNALEHGWYNEKRTFGDIIALCHSELSEALEEYRSGKGYCDTYYSEGGKPEGIPSELADCIIRILDFCGAYKIDIGTAILEKNLYNRGRSARHGGKAL